MNSADRIMQQKIRLLRQEPFFGVIVCRLIVQERPEVQTMATDGKHLWWCEDYVSKLNDVQLMGLLAHETLHVANLHMLRCGARDMKKWNLACDAAIDWHLLEAGFDVPDSFTKSPAWAWAKGLTAEVIYDRMPPDPPNSTPRPGGVQPSPAKGDAAKASVEVDMKITIRQAALAQSLKGKNKGSMPSWMSAMIDDICEPKVAWQDLLRNFISNHTPAGQTWARPNRKFVYKRVYLPGRLKEGLGELCVFVDTSGSQWSERPQFYAELRTIVEDMHPSKVHIIQCDAGVGNYACLEEGDFVEPRFVGGGGSDFRPAFQRIEEMQIRPAVGIVLSDMDINFPAEKPPYPVIGISTTYRRGPSWMETTWMHK